MISSDSPSFAFSKGRVPGCLQRRSKPGGVCPLAADHIKIIKRSDWPELANQISLRPYVKTVLDQGSVGSCATEGTTGSVMITRAFKGLEHVVLNPWFIYQATSGGQDSGSSIDDNLAYARKYGIAPESVWPRSKGWKKRPSEEAFAAALKFRIEEFYDITSIDEMVSALLQGFPVVYGAKGHAVVKIEHVNDRYGNDLNSWGKDWEDGGIGCWATYRAVDFRYGAFAVRVATEAST